MSQDSRTLARQLSRRIALAIGLASTSQDLWFEGRILTSLVLDLGIYSAARTLVAVGVRPAEELDARPAIHEAAQAISKAAAALRPRPSLRAERPAHRGVGPAAAPAETRV